MESEYKNKLIETFGKLFGEVISEEIDKYESNKKTDETNYSEDIKNIKTIIENAVDDICRYIGPDTALILDRLDTIIEKLGIIAANTCPYSIKPWTTGPQTYPYTPDPLNPLAPVITYCGTYDDRVSTTTTAGDSNFTSPHTYTSLTAEDIDSVLYSMFGQ